MKNIYLTNNEIRIGGSSLPDFFKQEQYKKNNSQKVKLVGNIQNQQVSFLVDAYHPYDNETTNSQWLIDISQNTEKYITKVELEKRFYILEIDDYSHQSMTTFYTDFVPLVFDNGLKIKQKYISIIKDYTNKKAFILIDKTYPNINSISNLQIIVAFKDTDRSRRNDFNLKNTNIELSKVENDSTKYRYTESSANNKFSFAFQNKNVNDYFITYNGKRINNAQIKSFIIDNGNQRIQKQGEYFTLVTRQRRSSNYENEINKNDNTLTIDIEFYNPLDSANSTVDKITLSSRSVLVDVFVKNKTNTSYYEYDKIFNTDVWYFDNNGNKKIINKLDNYSQYYELIPQYNNKRVIDFTVDFADNSVTSCTIQEALNTQVRPEIYRWNLKNPEMIYFDDNGKFKGVCNYDTVIRKGYEVIIYDNLEEIDDELRTADSNRNHNIIFTDLKVYDWNNTFDYNNLIELSGNNYKYEEGPFLSFYGLIKKQPNDYFTDVKFFVMAKYYPIYYEEYKIDDMTMYYRLPEAILQSMDPELFNSIESTLFVNRGSYTGSIYIIDPDEIQIDTEKALTKDYLVINENINNNIRSIITKNLYIDSTQLELDNDSSSDTFGTYKYHGEQVIGLDGEPVKTSVDKYYFINGVATDFLVAKNKSKADVRRINANIYSDKVYVYNKTTGTGTLEDVTSSTNAIGITEKIYGNSLPIKVCKVLYENKWYPIKWTNSSSITEKYIESAYSASYKPSITLSEHSFINRK